MAVHFKLTNADDLYLRTTSDKVIINNVDIFSSEVKEWLDSLTVKNYTEDNISLIPSCQCGHLKGEFYRPKKNRPPIVCEVCRTQVKSPVEGDISYLLWVERPVGISKLISPIAMMFLRERYKITKPNVSLIDWIIFPKFAIDKKQGVEPKNAPLLENLDFRLKTAGISRGYNSFVENFYQILDILEENFVKDKPENKQVFRDFIVANHHAIFSDRLPFPNKVMVVMETNELGTFIDKSLLTPINVIHRLSGIGLYTRTLQAKQDKIGKSIIELSNFYETYFKNNFFIKPGLIRQQLSSERNHFTARAVIVSKYGPHHYKDIDLPWTLSVSLFREHIIRALYARGFSYKLASNFIQDYTRVYHPLMDEIFTEIFAAADWEVNFLMNRNPLLHRGSFQAVDAVKVKKDPRDNTISMSYLIAPNYNADYDGDMLSILLVTTKKARNQLHNFKPHHSLLSMSGPNEFSDAIKFPKNITSTLAKFMEAE